MKKKLFIFILMVCIFAVFLTACQGRSRTAEERLSQKASEMLDALLTDDRECAYLLVESACDRETFDKSYEEMRHILAGVTEYRLTLVGYNREEDSYSASFGIETNMGQFGITVSEKADGSALLGVHLQKNAVATGTWQSFSLSDGIQRTLLIVGLLPLLLVIFAFVDCLCHPYRQKLFWAVFILFGMLSPCLTLGGQISFTLGYGFLPTAYTALLRYGESVSLLRVLVPVGAILYIALRGRLEKKNKN